MHIYKTFQGDIVKDRDLPANVTRLAWYRSEIHSNHANQTTGEMVNTPAITAMDGYGPHKGRVVLNSPVTFGGRALTSLMFSPALTPLSDLAPRTHVQHPTDLHGTSLYVMWDIYVPIHLF